MNGNAGLGAIKRLSNYLKQPIYREHFCDVSFNQSIDPFHAQPIASHYIQYDIYQMSMFLVSLTTLIRIRLPIYISCLA